jgi:hypothetical protein
MCGYLNESSIIVGTNNDASNRIPFTDFEKMLCKSSSENEEYVIELYMFLDYLYFYFRHYSAGNLKECKYLEVNEYAEVKCGSDDCYIDSSSVDGSCTPCEGGMKVFATSQDVDVIQCSAEWSSNFRKEICIFCTGDEYKLIIS